MITFTRTTNSVEVDFDSKEKHFIDPTSNVIGREGETFVQVISPIQGGSSRKLYQLTITEINGRPSDLALEVAEWLRDTYFSGMNYGSGGGGGDASAANQLTQIARLDTIITDLGDFADKTGSKMVTEEYDEQVIVYSDAANGKINYIQYKLLGVEVARETFAYDAYDNVTGIT